MEDPLRSNALMFSVEFFIVSETLFIASNHATSCSCCQLPYLWIYFSFKSLWRHKGRNTPFTLLYPVVTSPERLSNRLYLMMLQVKCKTQISCTENIILSVKDQSSYIFHVFAKLLLKRSLVKFDGSFFQAASNCMYLHKAWHLQ